MTMSDPGPHFKAVVFFEMNYVKNGAVNVNVNVIYLLSTIIKHYKAACTINELDSKAALLHLQLPTN